MRLGVYVFAALALIGMVGAFTYAMNPDYYVMEVMGINFNFPIALWVVLPMVLLFLFTVIHIFFYGLKNYFLVKRWVKDTNTLEDALYWSLVNEPKKQKYSIDDIGDIACILGKASLDLSDNVEDLSPRLSHAVNIIQKIKKGEYVDIKEEKMSKVFNVGNPILVQNRLNRLKTDETFPEDIMRSTSEYSPVVQAQALEVFANKENFTNAKKYAKVFDIKNFLVMLKRMNPENNLELTPEVLTDFVEALDFTCSDFVKIALVTKKYFTPEENLTLFRKIQEENEKAQNAYLYLLFDYELLEQVAIYFEEHEDNEFTKFRAFYELKNMNSRYRMEDIIDIHSVCRKTKEY
ncbi:MAG: hypothetical protein Q9M39_04140 [Sulfurovum sp.]|nr:hypothetical protein [Sulfurovum sp.]